MQKGTVNWFNAVRGFGFITPDDKDKDYFVHYSGIFGNGFKTLKAGDKVKFEEGEEGAGGDGRVQAVGVVVMEDE